MKFHDRENKREFEFITNFFEDKLQIGEILYTSNEWQAKAESRKEKMDELCWNEESSMYFDFVNKRQFPFEAATTFFPLWAGLCNAHQAKQLVEVALPQFIKSGGITGSTKASTSNFPVDAPQRQWDYPFGWSPHQVLLWEGLLN